MLPESSYAEKGADMQFSLRQSPDLYANINPSPVDRWLNCWLKKYKFREVSLKLVDKRV